ncbi:hypothetical protein FOZ63_016770, partial [Perkinsus olseni]
GIDSNTPKAESPKQRKSSSPKAQSSPTNKKIHKAQRKPVVEKQAVSPSSNNADKNSTTFSSRRHQEQNLQQLIAEAKAHQAELKSKRSNETNVSGAGPDPESVRARLRTATTKKEVEDAISDAKKLNMTYESSLGERKLASFAA